MAVANSPFDYAIARQNIFFTAHNQTPADGNLTGQCVTLLKWVFAEMCNGFPNPFQARGHARFVGKTLVSQGLAREVAWAERQAGDVICYEYGEYGHIVWYLGNGQVFEQNVNLGGVRARVVDGSTVYASRIASDAEAWRAGKNPHVYRLNNYQGGNMDRDLTPHEARMVYLEYGYDVAGNDPALVGRKEMELRRGIAGMVQGTQNALRGQTNRANGLEAELIAERQGYDLQIQGLQAQITNLTESQAAMQKQVDDLVRVNNIKDGEIKRLSEENAKLKAQLGDTDLSVKQAIRVLWQTIKDAISGK